MKTQKIKKNIVALKSCIQAWSVYVLLLSVIFTACSDSSGGTTDPDPNPDPVPGAVTAKETPKRATTDVRDSYGIFTLSTDSGRYTDYHLAVEETSATAPTSAQMTANALKRNIGTTAIHVLIAQRLNAPVVTFAKTYFTNTTKQTIGTGMTSYFDTTKASGALYDNTATGANAWVKESVLKPSTGYTLYGMKNGEITVSTLLTFTTDATAALGSTGAADASLTAANNNDAIEYVDSTLANGHITLSIRSDEVYIFPTQTDTGTGSSLSALAIYCDCQEVARNWRVLLTSKITFGGVVLGYNNIFYLARNLGTSDTHTMLQSYVLFTGTTSIQFGHTYNLTAGLGPGINYSQLTAQ